MFIHTCGFVCMISDDLLGLENHLRDIKICRYTQKVKRMIKISSNTPHLKSDLILPLHRSGRFKIKEQLLERKKQISFRHSIHCARICARELLVGNYIGLNSTNFCNRLNILHT